MTKNMRVALAAIGSILMFLGACDVDEGFDENDLGDDVVIRPLGGVWLNTSSIGALTFSQIDLTGQVLDGMALTDVFIPGPGGAWLRLDAVEITSAGRLRGRIGSTQYTGAELVGSRWVLDPQDGDAVEIRIAGHTQVSSQETRYHFKSTDGQGNEVDVCAPDLAGDVSSIPIKNIVVNHQTGVVSSRANTLYFACVSGAVGKAYTWGYTPQTHGTAAFEVAIRMARADYCYDGGTWTTMGTGVQARDAWSLTGFLLPDRPNEAVWTTSGLACLGTPRNSSVAASQVTCNGSPIPSCPALVGIGSYANTLFWTKTANS